MPQKLKRERHQLLASLEHLLEGPMIFLGFVWLLLLVMELIWGLVKPLEYLSVGIWALFIIDFFIKLVLAPDKGRFFRRNWLTALSLLIPALRVFKLVRVIRLLRGIRSIRLIRIVSSLNRSMRSLDATMRRRGFYYVVILSIVVTFVGAAGMYGLERPNPGFENYGVALWWTAMRIITAGSDFYPLTPEGRSLAFLLAVYGYVVFGYMTATLASFFIGRDAEEKDAPVASTKDIDQLRQEIEKLTKAVNDLNTSKP